MTGQPRTDSLRPGWTTGACATAAVTAAYRGLLSGTVPNAVTLTLPGGQTPTFDVFQSSLNGQSATASIIKDAGDDPDITHGAEIVASVSIATVGAGVSFAAGDGVGTVTLPGLALAPGEPAINPVPRKMMEAAIAELATEFNVSPDAAITLSIPKGETLAEKTMNGRLGIKGGLSILGTTGIVRPYSCSAWIHSIYRGIDVARALGHDRIAGATGSTSEAAVRKAHGLEESALIDMGDFAGGLLKYLRAHPLPHLTLAGGFAKMVKLGQGDLNLHSSKSSVNMDGLAEMLASLGADEKTIDEARVANTAAQVLNIAQTKELPLGDLVARRAREVALATLSGGTEVEILLFDRSGTQVGTASGVSVEGQAPS